ncbi:MAG TPA: xylulokinase, partial [Lachnospiraceae bacterium]|nr:xylulokinase [Lachnospiraceae bacterium]
MLYIGIDLGTSALKLLLMDEKGKIRKIVSKEYPLYFPHPGWSEQNPEDWMRAVTDGVKELTGGINKNEIAGIGAGGQMHGLVVLDENDEVIRPAILWNDGRTQKQTDELNNVTGRKLLSEYTGNIAFAGFTAPKLLWMRENEPELFARIKKVMLPKDYINYKLSGTFCTDYSDASGMLLLDVKNRCWSRQMLSICGISEKQMPRLYESYEAVGHLTPEMAEKLGLPEKVIIAAGAGDNAAAAVGTGTVGEGTCNISLGTSGTIFIPSMRFRTDNGNALHAFAHADGSFHLMGCMLSAASCNKWWMEDILRTSDFAKEQAAVTDDKLGTLQTYFLPYLMGERAPHNDPAARGCFIGLRMDTSREDMTQAVLEGIAFGM